MARSQPNLILSRLTDSDFRLIEADLEDVDLPVRKVLEQSHRRIDSVYFPESGFASVVANGAGKKPIEVGIIGREGMTGLAVLLGNERSKHETYMQAPGKGRKAQNHHLAQGDRSARNTAPLAAPLRQLLPRPGGDDSARQWPQHNRGAPRALAAYGR